jgi:ribosomal protein S18 acetylase RimI-like enzyme
MIEIVLYEDKDHADFKRLNLEWLDKYQLTEDHDLLILDNPRGIVLDGGGIIYMARSGDEMVGSIGLLKTGEGTYDLIKMSVTENFQGQGISKMLLDKCLETAREWKAKSIGLYSNSRLQRAIKMYEKYGFRHVPVVVSPLETADTRMELTLQ